MSRNQRDITFASFNLYNLQRPGMEMYAGGKVYSQDEYDKKIAWSAEMLQTLDADVIAFQELWNADALRDAFNAAGLSAAYDLAFIKAGPWDGIAVACAVRKPWEIRDAIRHKAFPDAFRLKKRHKSMAEIREHPTEADLAPAEDLMPSHEDDEIEVTIREFSRSPLQVQVGHSQASEVPTLDVFCAHLKSKLGTRLDIEEFRDPDVRAHKSALGAALSTIRRTAEATALRIILTKSMHETDTPTVLLGDLNDGQHSNTLNILTDQPSLKLYADSRAAARNDDGLFAAATLQQLRSLSDVFYSHEFKGLQEILDHCLVSEQFYEHAAKRLWSFREMHIWNDHLFQHAKHTSDHGLLSASFDWNPAG